MTNLISRDESIRILAAESLRGNLGLFIGAGFSRALTKNTAPSWESLLTEVSGKLKIHGPKEFKGAGISFPSIASKMAAQLKVEISKDPAFEKWHESELWKEATRQLKMEASRQIANFKADNACAKEFKDLFKALEISWIITTNYDFIIESCLEHPESFIQNQVFRTTKGHTPVIHLHGDFHRPESMVLLEEDYARAQNPGLYSHLRLAVTFAESTTLIMGYGLGDPNIHTAISYSQTFLNISPAIESRTGQLIILEWTSSPSAEARVGQWGEIIIETSNLGNFLDEVKQRRETLSEEWENIKTRLYDVLNGSGPTWKLSEKTHRDRLIEVVQEVPGIDLVEVGQLLMSEFTSILRKATAKGGWEHYKDWLDAAIDFLIKWPSLPPQLFEYIADELCTVSRYIAPDWASKGMAISATKLWKSRKKEFCKQPSVLGALKDFAERKNSDDLKSLLKDLKPQK